MKLSNGKQIWETEKTERERKVSQEEMRSIGQILMVIVSINIDRLYYTRLTCICNYHIPFLNIKNFDHEERERQREKRRDSFNRERERVREFQNISIPYILFFSTGIYL